MFVQPPVETRAAGMRGSDRRESERLSPGQGKTTQGETEMSYRGAKITDFAKEVAQTVVDLGNEDAYDIHLFLQQDGRHQEWTSGHVDEIPMYGVHCDRSYGGTEEAEEAVRAVLPNALVIFVDDEGSAIGEQEALEDAYGKRAEADGYDLDFACAVGYEIENLV
jgi:hypothetical protein